ncbi:MAG: hypothetical protein UW12_C0019G0001 [Parcubacteria group bacterium GW2011_GWF1_43_9]|nr:MAG: hypothetical protein UW12_C0019G0001 [Parcubacteria group bacterium GW2011_GWF1_43_9]
MAKLVNWVDFHRKLSKVPIFGAINVQRVFGVTKQTAALALQRYTKRGLVDRLRKGMYCLSGVSLPSTYIANRLYEPSYVSLEFALSYHGVIPETVYTITSESSVFTGYKIVKQGGLSFYIADAEKAFVDLTYLRMRAGAKPISRFNKEKLNPDKALRYARLFTSNKLFAIIKTTLR